MLLEISIKRKRMIDCALRKGFTSVETIQYSQELDALLNEYQRLLENPFKVDMKFNFKEMIKYWARTLVEI